MELMLVFPGFLNVNFHIIAMVHLLQDVFVDVHCYLGLFGYLIMKGHDSLGGSIEILPKLGEVVLVEVLDGYLSIDLVHEGFFMMSMILFSLVSWISLSRLEGSENFCAETVRRS